MKKIRAKIIINMLCLLLAACSTTNEEYYEPVDISFDASKVTNALPRVEPLSHYGNPAQYNVFGRQYHVLGSSLGYQREGIASWYGPKFNHKRTSSGEEYDMYQMTAANKELPLPTYALVSNLENGKSVIVKVNDRGPFVNDRIIDLSYAAAKKLDMTQKGTAYVRITAIDPTTWQEEHLNQHSYYVQAAAFSSTTNAINLQHKIEGQINYPVVVQKNNSGRLYNVIVGPIPTLSEEEHIMTALKTQDHIEAITAPSPAAK
jgi:rare lipoprotein A